MEAILIAVGLFLVVSLLLARRTLYLTRQAESERKTIRKQEELISELKATLANLTTLKGILPICACCKRIRDDKGEWNQLETFIREHSEADFSHGLCPECYVTVLSDGTGGVQPTGDRPLTTRRAGT
jgi:hypothetical protein